MATIITNSGNISYNFNGTVSTASSNNVQTTINDTNSLSAIKTAHMLTYRPGDNITYTFLVTNTGQSDLYNITIQDDMGKASNRLTYLAGSAFYIKNGVQIQVNPSEPAPNTFSDIGVLHPGESFTLTYVAKAPNSFVPVGTTIDNSAIINAHVGSAEGELITVDPVPESVVQVADFADVTISKSSSESDVTIGENFNYVFTLTNTGNIEATDVVLTDRLPDNFAIDSIVSETGGVETSFNESDYLIDELKNTLTLPTSDKTITVPAAQDLFNGITTITITGHIIQTI